MQKEVEDIAVTWANYYKFWSAFQGFFSFCVLCPKVKFAESISNIREKGRKLLWSDITLPYFKASSVSESTYLILD